MKRACSPNSITSLNYSSVTIECLERPDVLDDTESYISGGVLRGGKLAWLVRGATLEVVNTITGSRQASFRFGWRPHQQRSVCISSVSELHFEDGPKLLVGLKDVSGGGGGIVCIFDPFVSRVIKAIEFPYPVTVVEGVTGSGGGRALPHAFSPQLKLLFGIVAIGTEQGHCYLVDLRLDDEGEEFDEWHTSPIEVVNPLSHDLAQLRNTARTNGTHIGIEIGGFCHVFGRFSYVKCDFTELRSLSSDDVFVTAIKYVRQTSSLLVGFNFGCFQMWDMETLTHVYSSQIGQYYSAVTHFMYQVTVCLLVVFSLQSNCIELSRDTCYPHLIPTGFASRDTLIGYGVIYKELSGVGRRFEHQLTADAHHLADATSVGSKIICCYTLEKDGSSFDSPRMDEGATETDHVRDLTLAMCVWEAPAHDPHSRPTCHLGIFDINCWYHSQMPASIRDAMFGSKDPTCPFFAFFSLADILDAKSPDGIVDVFVDAKSVYNFVSSARSTLEQHLWPASLKFDTCCLMETGLVHSKFLGVQRQILANMSKQGISCLSDVHEYFQMCYVAGLLPRNFDLSKPQDKSFHHKALFSVALEHGLVTFITLCIQKLGAGNVTHAGCSLKLILDWAWHRVVDIKDQLDQLCVPLFDGGGGTPDEQMLLMLDNQKVQLAHLTTIFQALITQSAPITQQGVKDVEARYNVVSILSLYLRVVLWLIGQGLLPEQSEGSIAAAKRGHCYPAVSLNNACESRRKDLENLCSNDPGSVGLMVDKLITQLGYQPVSQWIAKGGSQQYPPSSLHVCSKN
ncbi:Protein ELYS [Desmophyllum pertusum]|uniref:Protein ELYS n=1 Tax=Desmophyllum pertusum TaxID=174260 RepID=A0A9X0A7B2_9CNID|nr:Protein ELYS [Desmophyllum pertusum]